MQTHLDLEVSEDNATRELRKFEFQADTMQVPCGEYSILSALRSGDVTAIEALVYLALNHASSWDSGRTWCISGRELARSLGISNWYVRSALERLQEKVLETVSIRMDGCIIDSAQCIIDSAQSVFFRGCEDRCGVAS